MRYIQSIPSEQTWLLPYSLDELVEENNSVRVIRTYVDSLPMEALGFARAVPAQTGRPAYDPRDLLKLYIYGYLNRIRSTRRLMMECRRNVELFYLLNMLKPDFRTIADFRKDNRKALEEVFKDFVKACAELKLLGKKTFAVDGTKIRTFNSKKKSFTPQILDKKLDYLREQEGRIEECLNKMDQEDEAEQKHARILELDIRPKDMPEKLKQIRERIGKYEGYQKRMKETGEDQIQETDPECRTIHTKPEDSRKCLHAGVLPRCYENTTISVQVQERNVVSCFIRHEDGTVTCPIGRELFKLRERKYGIVYKSQEACRTCPNRCTDSTKAKEVQIGHSSVYVPVYMYGNPEVPLQKVPDVEQNSPYNHFGRRKQKDARVKLILRRNPDDMQRRKELVEHPLGTIKWYDGAHYFLCRGEEKVAPKSPSASSAIIYAAPSRYWVSACLSRTSTKERTKTGTERPLILGFWTQKW